MHTHNSRSADLNAVQLTLDLPGFDFTPPPSAVSRANRAKSMPQHRAPIAAQVSLKLKAIAEGQLDFPLYPGDESDAES